MTVLLAMGDLHGTLESFFALRRFAEERAPDAIVLAGDLLRIYPDQISIGEGFRACGRHLSEVLDRVDLPLYYIMGNDDLVDWKPEKELFRSIHGKRVEIPPYNLVGYQYSPPFMNGIYEKPEERLAEDLGKLEPLVDENTVLVTHAPARGHLDEAHSGSVGSPAIRDFIEGCGPRVHIHGHIHRAFGRDGIHFNAASGGEERALLIDIDAMTHEELRA